MNRKVLRIGFFSQVTYYGGYSGEDPPLTIPNREVKLTIADGTDPPVGRVGSRRFRVPDRLMTTGDFFLRVAQKSKTPSTAVQPPAAARPPPRGLLKTPRVASLQNQYRDINVQNRGVSHIFRLKTKEFVRIGAVYTFIDGG